MPRSRRDAHDDDAPPAPAEDADAWTLPAPLRRALRELPLREKIRMMSGEPLSLRVLIELATAYNTRPYTAGALPSLGVEGVRFTDGPRGVVLGRATCFPVAIARGATWDPALEERVGAAMGAEARALGANLFAGICVNLLRHPAWGRAQETYGEDPVHVGALGAAMVRGVQRHVMACVKHFACNSIENARFRVDVRIDERALRELYLPHFRECVEAGAVAIMSAYNKVNGQWCGHHKHLLTDILKREWGFRGFVLSDFLLGVRDGPEAVLGGLDLEMPLTIRCGAALRRAALRGRVPEARIDDAIERMVGAQRWIAARREPTPPDARVVACDEHRALAREVARRSMVLLKNERPRDGVAPMLPLEPEQLRRLAVIGRLARAPNTGDIGSSMVRPPHVVTPLAGLEAAAASAFAVEHDDGRRLEGAEALARASDAVVLVVGLSHRDEGENLLWTGGDRDALTLRPGDERLIRTVAAANPRVAVVLIAGGPLITEAWRGDVPAILMAWYPGMEGGHAIADLLLGRSCPSGKLPCVFPRAADALPTFNRRARRIRYDLLHGQRLHDARGDAPAFALGYGLSYTRVRCGPPTLAADTISGEDGVLELTVELCNLGDRAGNELVQVYVSGPDPEQARAVRTLVAFRRVGLDVGESRVESLRVEVRRLARYDAARGRWRVAPGPYRVEVGTSSRAIDLGAATLTIRASTTPFT
ncbi:MAG: glycoside hydrolase family 3 C-terminal domain-containing protein [Myxococcales bacterium]|nr:glycoside hydrolase family 3 C-terminal domain-containing protein [Myxococcales bacterium]